MKGKFLLMVLAAGLVACGGGDDDGDSGGGAVAYCSEGFEGGSSNWGCTSCSGVDPLDDTDDFDPAIDGRAGTFTEFGLSSGGQMVISVEAPSGAFDAGSDAGALIRFPAGTYNTIGVQFRALFNGAVVSSSGGSSSVSTKILGRWPHASSPSKRRVERPVRKGGLVSQSWTTSRLLRPSPAIRILQGPSHPVCRYVTSSRCTPGQPKS